MRRRRAAQVARVIRSRQPGHQAVRRDPVGSLGEDGAAVHHKLERLAPWVGVPVQRDRAQADPARPMAKAGPFGVRHLDLQPVERLAALAVRPPELGVLDHDFRPAAFRHDRVTEGQAPAADRRGIRPGDFRRQPQQHDAVGPMLLRHAHALQPVAGPAFETEVAPEAGGDQARPPIPAKLALLLAQAGAAADRVVDFTGLVLGPVRADVLHRALEADEEFVPAGAQVRLHLPAIAGEHVVGARDFAAVEPDGGDGVEPVGHQFQHLLRPQFRRDGEAGAILPVAFFDPLHVRLVGTPERIRNQVQAPQVAVDATRHDRGAPGRASGGIAKLPPGISQGKQAHGGGGSRVYSGLAFTKSTISSA